MPKVVKQSVVLPATAKALYAMYLSPKAHGSITGAKVAIGSRPGSSFRAFGGKLRGRVLQTIPGRLIVQAWRSSAFRKREAEPTVVIRLPPKGESGRGGLG